VGRRLGVSRRDALSGDGMTEIEEAPGVVSNMRKTVRTGRRAGVVMIFAGIGLASASLILNRGYELAPVYTTLVSLGAGMITGLGFAKAIQTGHEVRSFEEQ
jgi:hypothetical protein